MCTPYEGNVVEFQHIIPDIQPICPQLHAVITF
jgi:hypothetical protein